MSNLKYSRKSSEQIKKEFEEEKKVTKNLIEYVKSKKPEEIYLSPENREIYEQHNKLSKKYRGKTSDILKDIEPYVDEKDFVIKQLEWQLRFSENVMKASEEIKNIEERTRPDPNAGKIFIGAEA